MHHARARQMADDRAHGVLLAALRHQLVDAHVVAPVLRARGEPVRDPVHQRVVDPGALDEEHVQPLVAALGEQERPRRPAVAARAAGLLVVGLQRARDGLVAHRAHVGLVDAHPERVRGDDHLDLARHESPLGLGAVLARQAGVVGERLDPARVPA